MPETTMSSTGEVEATRNAARALVADLDPNTTDRVVFLREQFDRGLAWVHYPVGMGGRDADPSLQVVVNQELALLGAPDNAPHRNVIGLGMAAPTLLRVGTPEQQRRWLRPLWTGEDIWCQLFSEPDAGSDLASLATRAVRDGGDWVVNGQKVWTSLAHDARWALLVARTDPDVPKHQGLTYFVCDMQAKGVDVRSLRQLTGESEFSEVFLEDVRIPDEYRVGDVGDGWRVTQTTLMNERMAIGGAADQRESGQLAHLLDLWRTRPQVRHAGAHDRLLQLWVTAEAVRLTGVRLRQRLASGQPGPEASGLKLAQAELDQAATSLELELLGGDGLLYDDWTDRRPDLDAARTRLAGYRYLRARANSIEGGTSEIMRNIIAERVLGMPAEPRADVGIPWRDVPR